MTKEEADEALRRRAFMMAEAIEYLVELRGARDNEFILRLWEKIKPALEVLREDSPGKGTFGR